MAQPQLTAETLSNVLFATVKYYKSIQTYCN